MISWAELYDEHSSLRPASGRRSINELREVLRRISELSYTVLDSGAQQRLQAFSSRESGFQTVQFIDEQGEELHMYAHPGVDRGEIHLVEARLTVQLLIHRASDYLHWLTIMVEGKRRAGGDWVVAVHLPDDRPNDKSPGGERQGHGACGHAVLHAHVGSTMNEEPKVRVPLPRLGAGRILEWVLSQVVPTLEFEAAPWTSMSPRPKT
jgi:hypothetical protein